ncbi:hypothetical protein pdam_00015847, partial [Pocillopora damicornis]
SDFVTIYSSVFDHEVTPSPEVSSTSLKTLEVTSSSVVATFFRAVDVKTTNSCTSDYEVTLLPGVTATSPDAQELTSSKVELTTLKRREGEIMEY